MTRSSGTVVFSHGRESGPWGSKITAMAAMVRTHGWAAESVDYRGLDDPSERVRKLLVAGCAENIGQTFRVRRVLLKGSQRDGAKFLR